MHPHLESYLEQVAKHLRGLAAARREDELHELGQHLQAIVDAEIAEGHSETEAIERALRQFGPAKRVGRDLYQSAEIRLPKGVSVVTLVLITEMVYLPVFVTAFFLHLAFTSRAPLLHYQFLTPLYFFSWPAFVLLLAIGTRQFRAFCFWGIVAFQLALMGLMLFLLVPFVLQALQNPAMAMGLMKAFNIETVPYIGMVLLHIVCLFLSLRHWKLYMKLAHAKRGQTGRRT